MVETAAKKESVAKEHLEPLPGQALKARENLLELLKEAKAADQASNLYDHIVEVLNRLVASCPDRALERFEEVSYLVKNKDTLALGDFVKVHESRDYCVPDAEVAKGTQEHIDKVRGLFEVSHLSSLTMLNIVRAKQAEPMPEKEKRAARPLLVSCQT